MVTEMGRYMMDKEEVGVDIINKKIQDVRTILWRPRTLSSMVLKLPNAVSL